MFSVNHWDNVRWKLVVGAFVPMACFIVLAILLVMLGIELTQFLIPFLVLGLLVQTMVILTVTRSLPKPHTDLHADATEEALDEECDESELTFSPVFHANPLPTSITTVDEGRYAGVNDAWTQLFGYTSEEAIGNTSLGLNIWVHPEERADLVRQLQTNGAVRDFEHLARTKNGDQRHVLVSAQVIEFNGTRYNLSVVHDVTELRAGEERLNLVMRATNDGIWDWNTRTGEVYYSPRWKSMLGYAEDEIGDTNDAWLALVHPDDYERAVARSKEDMAGTEPEYVLEHRLRHKDGSYRWILSRGIALRDATGKTYRMVGSHTDITELKRAEEKVRRHNAYLRALHQVTLGVIGELNVNELLTTVVERVVELIDAAYGLVYLVIPEQDALELCVATGEFRHRTGTRMKRGEGLSGRVWQTGEPLAVDDYQEWPDRSPYFDGAPVHAAMGLPLKSGGQVIGVLGLTRVTTSTPFDQEEQDLATRFAHLASIALVNARLHTSLQAELTEHKHAEEALQHRLAFERLITNISTEFINLGPDEINSGIEQALAAIGRFTGSDRSYVFLFSQNGTRMSNPHEWCRAGIESLQPLYEKQSIETLPWTMAQIRQGKVVHVPSFCGLPPEAEVDKTCCSSHQHPTLSFINVPMIYQGQVIGLLGFDAVRAEKTWSEDTIALLRIVGEIFVSALERKLAAEKLEEAYRTLEQRVAERTHELATLNAISASVSRSLDLKEIMADALERMMELTGMEHGVAYRISGDEDGTLDAEHAYLRVMAFRGLPPDFANLGDGIPLRQSAAGVAGRHGEPMIWSLAELPSQSSLKQRLASQGVQQVIAIPLMAKGRFVGSLNLSTNRIHTYPPEQIALLKAIGQQVGVAVENARLYERAEQSAQIAERSRLARELHDSVTQSLYSMTLYAEATARLLTAEQTEQAAGHLRDLRDTAQEALREMRLLIFELRPPALENGLANALQNRLDSVESRGGLKSEFLVQGKERGSLALQIELYHIALEALNNSLKHANAHHVRVDLQYQDESIQLQITDDGIGFDPAIARLGGGLGLTGMQERAQRIGATLTIDSTVGNGTRIRVCVPVHSRENGETP